MSVIAFPPRPVRPPAPDLMPKHVWMTPAWHRPIAHFALPRLIGVAVPALTFKEPA